MIELHLADPGVQSAIIQSGGSILAALIAAVCAAIIGKQIAGRKKLQSMLQAAVADIEFLLVVEEEHCTLHRARDDGSNKMRIRQKAQERGLAWSGRFTPGRVKALSVLQED